MKITTGMKKLLLDEIDYVIKNMKSTQEPGKKLYYFSAIYGCALRIINIEFDPELAFIHHVTNMAYGQINASLSSVNKTGATATIPENIFESLEKALADLGKAIEANQKTYPILERIANIAYSSSGNGYYLYLKGILEL